VREVSGGITASRLSAAILRAIMRNRCAHESLLASIESLDLGGYSLNHKLPACINHMSK